MKERHPLSWQYETSQNGSSRNGAGWLNYAGPEEEFTQQKDGSWLSVTSHAKGTWHCNGDPYDPGASMGTILSCRGPNTLRIAGEVGDVYSLIAVGSYTLK